MTTTIFVVYNQSIDVKNKIIFYNRFELKEEIFFFVSSIINFQK